MRKKLLLWDIDGTLTYIALAGERAILAAWKKVMGYETTLEDVDYRGRTDVLIFQKLLTKHHEEHTHQRIHDLAEDYLASLPEEVKQANGNLHPGVLDILEQARQRPDIVQGLLTGNLSQGAKIKLEHFDAWHYFEFGAFANDSSNRNDLGPVALQRAAEKYGHEFHAEDTFIIGDTPHDIACAKVIGANCIAVATGAFSVEDLSSHQPTVVFKDLSDAEAFFRVVDASVCCA